MQTHDATATTVCGNRDDGIAMLSKPDKTRCAVRCNCRRSEIQCQQFELSGYGGLSTCEVWA